MKKGISIEQARGNPQRNFIYGEPQDGWKITFRNQYGIRETYMQIGFTSLESAERELACIKRNIIKWRKMELIDIPEHIGRLKI
ncbi:MAG: hypothetical protein HC831_20640 [Chloroflexia bacterium]|nr:hypothetical protein [Chloroflexia bacterium]